MPLPIWLRRCKETVNLQYGKLAWFDNKEGREHETDTGSKHGQGCEKQATKDEQAVPPTHYEYCQRRSILVVRVRPVQVSRIRDRFAQELPPITVAQPLHASRTGSCPQAPRQ